MKNKNEINSNQLIFYTFASQVGMGIMFLPNQLAEVVGHDGWISVLIGGIIFSGLILFVIALMNRYKNKSIFEINKLLYGKYIGYIFNLCLIIYVILFSAYVLRMMVEAMQLMGLKTTPRIILTIFIIIPTIYSIKGGLKNVCRYLHIVIFIGTVLAIYIFFVAGRVRLTFLMPIGEANVKKMISGVKISIFAYLGIELIPFIYSNVSDKKNITKKVLLGNLFSIIVYTLIAITTTGLFGEMMLKRLEIPLLSLSRVCYSNIFERVDLYFVATWIMAMGCVQKCYMFAGYFATINIFNIKAKKWIAILVLYMLVCIISLEPREFIYMKKWTEYLGWVGLSVIFFYIFSYILSFINKRGVSK